MTASWSPRPVPVPTGPDDAPAGPLWIAAPFAGALLAAMTVGGSAAWWTPLSAWLLVGFAMGAWSRRPQLPLVAVAAMAALLVAPSALVIAYPASPLTDGVLALWFGGVLGWVVRRRPALGALRFLVLAVAVLTLLTTADSAQLEGTQVIALATITLVPWAVLPPARALLTSAGLLLSVGILAGLAEAII